MRRTVEPRNEADIRLGKGRSNRAFKGQGKSPSDTSRRALYAMGVISIARLRPLDSGKNR